jgi:hypothetical protein
VAGGADRLVQRSVALTGISPQASVVFGLGIWLVFALMSAVLIVCASQAYLGEPVDVGVAARQALPRLPQVLLGRSCGTC